MKKTVKAWAILRDGVFSLREIYGSKIGAENTANTYFQWRKANKQKAAKYSVISGTFTYDDGKAKGKNNE